MQAELERVARRERASVSRLLLAPLGAALALALLAAASIASRAPRAPAPAWSATELLGGEAQPGYLRALEPPQLVFPRDHGAHEGYRSEWWYVTGNLADARERRYGFQLTFFRVALAPPREQSASEHARATPAPAVWLAHFALTDAEGARFHAHERSSGETLGTAGARAPHAERGWGVWLEDWRLGARAADSAVLELAAREGGLALELELEPLRPVALHGEGGLSRKGAEPGNASIYYAQTRFAARGTLELAGETRSLSGEAWLDREWSTSALGAELAGWDWFALQLEGGGELMLYELRRADGTRDPYSRGAWMLPAEPSVAGAHENAVTSRELGPDDYTIEVLSRWRSPRTAALYPSRWHVDVPSLGLELELRPLLADQELDLSVRYWEGAIEAFERASGARVGRGYAELTGYGDGKRPR